MFSRVKPLFAFTKSANHSDLKSIFYPMYITLALIGIFPYSITLNSKGCNIKNKSVYFNAVCALTINLIVLAFNFFHLQHIVLYTDSSNFTDAITTQINYILEVLNLQMVVIVAYVCAYKNGSKYIKILNSLSSSWSTLPRYGNRVLEKLRLQVRIIVIVIGLLFFAMLVVNFSRSDTIWKIILVSFSFNLTMLIQCIEIAFYNALILMIVASLRIINENCLSIIKDTKSPMGYFIKMENRSATVSLRNLELIYVKVMETKREINAAFEGTILLTLLQCFHSMVSEAYIIYHGVAVKKNFTLHETVNCSLWLCYQALKIYAISWTGNKLKYEAIKIGQNLHNIPVDKLDQRMFMEIQHFSSLLLHQSADLTVFGFFPIDATLLFNVMASAAMYLIILLQFDKKE